MLDGLRQFIADIVSPGAHQDRTFDDTGYRLAATALLIHVISLDGEPSEIEKRKLHGLIEARFGLDPGTADQLIASAMLVEARRAVSIILPASSCVWAIREADFPSSRWCGSWLMPIARLMSSGEMVFGA